MRVLYGCEEKIAMSHISAAALVARQSMCLRSRCGSVIVSDGQVIASGYNAPPRDMVSQQRCLRKSDLKPGFKSDKTCCIHAEQRAIYEALKGAAGSLAGSRLYFIRLDAAGLPERAGRPYCTHCSKLVLDVGIAEFVLWHQEGVTVYDTVEYNDLSFAFG